MAVASSTPVPTPGGWVLAKNLTVGDYVFADDGSVQRVTVSQNYSAECYTLTMDDGVSVTGDKHLAMMLQTKKWRDRQSLYLNYKTDNPRKKFRRPLVRRTMADLLEGGLLHRGLRLEYSLAIGKALQYPWVDLPVPPYVLGVWWATLTPAGRNSAMGRPMSEIRKRTRAVGFNLVVKKLKNGRPAIYFRPSIKESFLFADALPPTGIPSQYLRAGVEQRRDLLDGLIDGGMINKHVVKGKHSAYFANYREAKELQELVEGLGFKSLLTFLKRDKVYELVFKLEDTNFRFSRRFLTKIEPAKPQECSHLLAERPILVGEGFIAVC